jgi:hypothetical protein
VLTAAIVDIPSAPSIALAVTGRSNPRRTLLAIENGLVPAVLDAGAAIAAAVM